jgi:hypothetical protein
VCCFPLAVGSSEVQPRPSRFGGTEIQAEIIIRGPGRSGGRRGRQVARP